MAKSPIATSFQADKPRRKYVRKSVTKTATRTTKTTTKTPQQSAAQALSTALADVARVVLVNFQNNSNMYSYYTRDPSIVEGDYCIVISPFASHISNEELGGFPSVVQVKSIRETVESVNAASKWIVGKLDLTSAIEEAKKREQIKVLETKIKKARKAAEERVKLDQLRELSPELNELILQLDALR